MNGFSLYIEPPSYVQVIDLCTIRSEIIHVSPKKKRFCIAVPFDLMSQF